MSDQIDRLGAEVTSRARMRAEKHGPFASAHEACSIIREEFEELWAEAKKKDHARSSVRLRDEALDIATAALRYAAQIEAAWEARGPVDNALLVESDVSEARKASTWWCAYDDTKPCERQDGERCIPCPHEKSVCGLCDGTGEVGHGGFAAERCWRCGGTGDAEP